LIAYFEHDNFLGSYDGKEAYSVLPSYHFFCPNCGEIWARIICEPGDSHRIFDSIWCGGCARNNTHGIRDGIIDVYWWPEYLDLAPKEVLIHNFMQAYDNRVRLDSAGIEIISSIKYRPDNSELLARLMEEV